MTSKFLACTSDRGTIHIFSLATANDKLGKEQKFIFYKILEKIYRR